MSAGNEELERLLQETRLLIPREDGYKAATEARDAIRALFDEREGAHEKLRKAVNEWGECSEGCDSYGHAPGCGTTEIAPRLIQMQTALDEREAQVAALVEAGRGLIEESLKYPKVETALQWLALEDSIKGPAATVAREHDARVRAERDKAWCEALLLLDPKDIERVTRYFNEHRPDKLSEPGGGA